MSIPKFLKLCISDASSPLSGVKKFNSLHCFLDGEASHVMAGLSVTNENYKEALCLLKKKYGNPQLVEPAQISALLNLAKVESDDLHRLRKS